MLTLCIRRLHAPIIGGARNRRTVAPAAAAVEITRRIGGCWQAEVENWRADLARVDAALDEALRPNDDDDRRGRGGKRGRGGGGSKAEPRDPSAFARPDLAREVESVVRSYDRVASRLVRAHVGRRNDGERVTGALLRRRPFASDALAALDETQNRFLESSSLKFHAVTSLPNLAPSEAFAEGLDRRSFLTARQAQRRWQDDALKNSRYGRSSKSLKVKKDLPKKARLDAATRSRLAEEARAHNRSLMARLWSELSPKNDGVGHRVRTAYCKWEKNPFRRGLVWRKREATQLRDRAASLMIEGAARPIAECGACPGSFAWRPRRSASRAVEYAAGLLSKRYSSRPGIIRIDAEDCFDEISHDAILDAYPLGARHVPFLENFLKAPRRGHQTPEQTTHLTHKERKLLTPPSQGDESSWRPTRGVVFDSTLGRALVNNAFDGLEEALRNPQSGHDDDDAGLAVIRYGASILVIGPEDDPNDEIVERAGRRLLLFLSERGLGSSFEMENARFRGPNGVFRFRPGASFEFLGFRFLHAPLGEKGRWNSRGERVHPDRFRVSIAPSSVRRCNESFRGMLSRRHAPADVGTLIRRCNEEMARVAGYFDVSSSARRQLNNLARKNRERMWKLLRIKFGSSPKLATVLKSKFYSRGKEGGRVRIRADGVEMLGAKDFSRRGRGRSFAGAPPTRRSLSRNVYLGGDCDKEGEEEQSPTPAWIDDVFAPQFKLLKGDNDDDGGDNDDSGDDNSDDDNCDDDSDDDGDDDSDDDDD